MQELYDELTRLREVVLVIKRPESLPLFSEFQGLIDNIESIRYTVLEHWRNGGQL